MITQNERQSDLSFVDIMQRDGRYHCPLSNVRPSLSHMWQEHLLTLSYHLGTMSNIHCNLKDQQHHNFFKLKTKDKSRRKRMRKANCVAKKSDIFVVGHSCQGNRHSSDGSELQMRRWSCVVLPSHALCRGVDPLLLVGGSNSVTDTIQELTRSLFLNKPALFVYLDLVKDAFAQQ